MEPQMPHMQHYAGPVNPQMQSAAMDQQAINHQNLIRSMDPQSLGRPMEHQPMSIITSDNQTVSRPLELHSLSRPMDSHPLARPIDVNQFHVADTYNIPAIMGMQLSQQHMVGTLEPLHMTAGPMVQPTNNDVSRMNQQFHEHIEKEQPNNEVRQMNQQFHEHIEKEQPNNEVRRMNPQFHEHVEKEQPNNEVCRMNPQYHEHLEKEQPNNEVRRMNPQYHEHLEKEQPNNEVSRMNPQFHEHIEKEIAEKQTQVVPQVIESPEIHQRPMGEISEKSNEDHQHQHMVECQVPPAPAPVSVTHNDGIQRPAETSVVANYKPQIEADDGVSSVVQPEVAEQQTTQVTVDQVKVYRQEMKSLCEKLSKAGEESVVLTTSPTEKKVHKFGSKLGLMFLTGNTGMLDGFLTFCRDQFNAEVTIPSPILEKKKRGRKKKSEVEQPPEPEVIAEKAASPKESDKAKPAAGKQRKSSRIENVMAKQEPLESLPATTGDDEEEEDDNNVDFDDPADSDYDVTNDTGVDVESIKVESAGEDEQPRMTRSRKRKSALASKHKKKLVKGKRKGKTLSVQISKLKMKISSDKKNGKEANGRNWQLDTPSVEDETCAVTTTFQCEYCQNEFLTAAELKSHKHKLHEDKIIRQKNVNHKGGYRFTCVDCSASFKSRSNLKRHLVYYSEKHDFTCVDCEKTFLYKKDLIKHRLKHSKVKPYECEVCSKSFKTEEGRKLHTINFHGPNGPPLRSKAGRQTFDCSVCGGLYASRSALQKHELVHERDLERKERLEALVDFSANDEKNTPENSVKVENQEENIQEKDLDVLDLDDIDNSLRPKDLKLTHECDQCGKKFPTNRDLKTHKNGHDRGKSSYDCNLCGRVFLTRISLYRHRHIHTKSGKYTCRICGKKYASLDYLIKHGKLHNAEPPFKCDVCQKGFHEKRYMQYHLATHTKEKPYMCDKCGRTFRTPQQQKDHAMSHSDERPHSCDICGKAFKLRDTLRVHKQTHETALNFMCGTCGRRFNRAYNLRKHEKVHLDLPAFICKDCGKACKTQVSLKSHWISFHLKPEDVANCKYTVWQCSVCSKPFAERMDRDVHMRTHTGEKPFSCEYCGKAFADKSNLRAHVRNHQGDKSKLCTVCGKGFTFNRDLKKHMLIHGNTGQNKRSSKKEKTQMATLTVPSHPVVTTATVVRPPQQVWSEAQHPEQQQQQQQPRLAFHQETISPRIEDQLQPATAIVEASAEALNAAYALTMAREATVLQQITNPGGQTNEFTWQYL